jgi:F-type H+-transporting ATPase subunit a
MHGGFGEEPVWYPLTPLGITSSWSAVNATTIINTWIAFAVLAVVIVLARYFLHKKDADQKISTGAYIVKSALKSLITLVEQSAGTFVYKYYAFVGSLFIFIIFCNWVALLPYVKEPTKDLNTTLALGISSFAYMQKEIIHVHGIRAYLKEYFRPISVFLPLDILAGILHLPLKLMGELASIISLSFRLFGNIFGGAIILTIIHQLVADSLIKNALVTFFGINLVATLFFVLFEGFLQAFVFSILTLTNISMATALGESVHD